MAADPLRSAPISDPIRWFTEGSDQGVDPDTGVTVRRMTSGPLMNHAIYCEQPYASPDGRRIAVLRGLDFALGDAFALVIAEPQTLACVRIERSIPGQVAHHVWTEWLYYGTHAGGVRRVSFTTLVKEEVLPDGAYDPARENLSTATHDGGTIFVENLRAGIDTADRQIAALDTRTGHRRVIFSDVDNINPHSQIEPRCNGVGGERIAAQLVINRPGRPSEVPLLVMGVDGSNPTRLPIGGRHTAESTGHIAWVPGGLDGRARLICAVEWDRAARRHDPRHPQGNLVIAGPGDAEPRILEAPGHGFWHVATSRCGRYFVADDFIDFRADQYGPTRAQGPVRLVVGNLLTGRTRVVLRDCQMQGLAGTSRWEPDPYITADNRYVIFNASPLGALQVFAAELPEGFLAALD